MMSSQGKLTGVNHGVIQMLSVGGAHTARTGKRGVPDPGSFGCSLVGWGCFTRSPGIAKL